MWLIVFVLELNLVLLNNDLELGSAEVKRYSDKNCMNTNQLWDLLNELCRSLYKYN